MMKAFFDQPSPDVSIDAPPGEQSKSGQDMVVKFKKNTFLSCFLEGVDRIRLARMVIAEAVGTFILMFCIFGIVSITELMGGQVGILEYSITAALTVIVVIFSIGAISGAHVNPAVTIAFAAFGPFPWPKVPLYVLAQIVGSVLATLVGKSVYGVKTELVMTKPIQGIGAAFGVELIATFIILFLAAAVGNEAQSVGHLSGFAVGVAIGLGVMITGPVSGGSMNPARSLGPALISWDFEYLWIYLLAPTVGASAGVILFRALRLQGWACSSMPSPDTRLLAHSLY